MSQNVSHYREEEREGSTIGKRHWYSPLLSHLDQTTTVGQFYSSSIYITLISISFVNHKLFGSFKT